MASALNPPELKFDQTQRITDRLRELVRGYPKGLGLVKEFLQNADDAGASTLLWIYDRRQHTGVFVNPAMEVALGPSLLFVNDKVFSDDDFERIQQIGEGGKVLDSARTGRFGQGFNTCYSVTDHPSFLTGDKVAWYDPHQHVFGPGKNAHAWTLSVCEQYFPDWIKTFVPAGFESNSPFFSGTVFRLPVRTADNADKSKILDEPFKDEDFESILDELQQVGAALLIFLRSVTNLEVREIEPDGNVKIRYRISTSNVANIEKSRSQLRNLVEGNPKTLIGHWLESDDDLPLESYDHEFSIIDLNATVRNEIWGVVIGLFRGPENILLHQALKVCRHNEKAIPWAGAATLRNNAEKDQSVKSHQGGLSCFLPIPEQTKWPVWLHGWFDLKDDRSGITRIEYTSEITKIRFAWNLLLMEHAVSKAWSLLVLHIQKDAEECQLPYAHWLDASEEYDAIDSALVKGFYHVVTELPIIRGYNSDGYFWSRISKDICDLPTPKWANRLLSKFVEEGWSVCKPSLPEFVRQGFKKAQIELPIITPANLRDLLKIQDDFPDVACEFAAAPMRMLTKQEWIPDIVEFCAEGDIAKLKNLPLAILADGLLHTFSKCGKILLVSENERKILQAIPERFLEPAFQSKIGINNPVPAVNIEALNLENFIDCVSQILAQGQTESFWLTDVLEYLSSKSAEEVISNKDKLKSLDIIPSCKGTMCKMGYVNTPLIPAEIPTQLFAALLLLNISIFKGGNELIQAATLFASKHKGFLWNLTPNDVVDILKSHVESTKLNEAALDDRAVLHPILDYVSSVDKWLKTEDDRLPYLRQLRILPTTCGQRVAADDDAVYIPDFTPPKGFDGQYRLLNTGRGERWLDLFEALKIPRLNGVRFVRRVLLPAFNSATPDQCRDYLKWLRDDFRSVERDLTEDERKELHQDVRQKPILPVEGGGLYPPKFVYLPDEKEPEALLGEFAKVPDKDFFSVDKDLWSDFFDKFDLPRRPLARDLYLKIKALSDEASSIAGTSTVRVQIHKLIDHISSRWSTLASRKVDGGATLADALSKIAWLPASTDENNYAASNKWLDQLWRADQLVPPGRLANLCASKYPILEGSEFPKEMSDALGIVTNLNLNDILEHFSRVQTLSIHDEKSMEAVHKASEEFYRYIGRLDIDKVVQSADILDDLKEQLCIFIAGKWWHPTLCFFDHLPFTTDWAVSLTMTNLKIDDSAVNKGLAYLGVRQRPENDDWILMLTDYADKFQGKPLPQAKLYQVHYAISLLRSASTEWLHKQEVFVPLMDGRLENARNTFVSDDPRLKKYTGTISIPLIEGNDDALDVGFRAGAKSLRKSLIERLKVHPSPTKNTSYSEFASSIESNIKSEEFYYCLQRIAYEKAINSRDIDIDPKEAAFSEKLKLPQTMRIIIAPSINVETVVEIDGEEKVVFDLESSRFLEKEIPRLWLKEAKQSKLKNEIVRAICELCDLSDPLSLSLVLNVKPDQMAKVLDEEEIATIPIGEVLDLVSNSVGVIKENYSDSSVPIDYEQDCAGEIDSEDEDNDEYSNSSSELMGDPDHSASSKSIEPPTKPGHGSSNPWRDNSTFDSEQKDDNSVGTSHPPRLHGSPFTPHSPGNPSPHGHVQHPSSTKSSTSFPGGPPTNPGHGSSKQWDSQLKGAPDSSRQVRMRTYVHEKIHDDYDTGDADSRAKKLGNAGEEIVMEYEKKRKRSARRMPVNHEGYDIESKGRDGIRYIEVKSIDGPWGDRGVGVTRAQYEAAMRLGKEWWLYVVEYVTDSSRINKVHAIANPFHLATEFRFDSGWKGAQVDESGVSPVSSKPKIGASYERASGEIVKVEGTTQRGEFWRVNFVDPDGTMQRAMWDASWRMI